MNTSFNSRVPWALLLYIFILLSPSMMFSPKGMIRGLYPLLILIAVINRWRPFLLVTLPIILFVPAAHFLQINFKAPMNESFWVIIQGSNVNEATDYLKANAVWPILSSLLALAYWAWLYRKNITTPLVSKKPLRIFFLLLLIVPLVHFKKGQGRLLAEFNHHFTESFPLNVILSYSSAKADIEHFQKLQEFKNISELKILDSGPEEQTLVVVIGESARRDRMQLYGAKNENNPYLSKIKSELYLFTDFISLHPHTVASLPVIFSRQKGVESDFEFNYSFVNVLKAAGFKTFWISNQASLWGPKNLIGHYARSTDFQHFFHLHAANNPTAYDEDVLNLFREKITDPAPKKLFVLHLQGSHYSFEKRYPLGFGNFSDSYDNSLQYTDFILAEIITSLKDNSKSTALFYVSDHGLLLDACGKKYTHFDNKESYEVPAILWMSDDKKRQLGPSLPNLDLNLKKPLTTQTVFDSLIDLSGVSYANSIPQLSFLRSEVNVGERLVKTYSQVVDYDKGQNNLECRLSSP